MLAKCLLAVPDKFRGTLSAREAAAAMAAGARSVGWLARELPLADGGEGTLDAFGGPNQVTTVTGPLGQPVDAAWRLDGDLAVIEMARASGLAVAGGREANDPVGATTRGTGDLIDGAVRAGARTLLVAVGGSAATDGGAGTLASVSTDLRCGSCEGGLSLWWRRWRSVPRAWPHRLLYLGF